MRLSLAVDVCVESRLISVNSCRNLFLAALLIQFNLTAWLLRSKFFHRSDYLIVAVFLSLYCLLLVVFLSSTKSHTMQRLSLHRKRFYRYAELLAMFTVFLCPVDPTAVAKTKSVNIVQWNVFFSVKNATIVIRTNLLMLISVADNNNSSNNDRTSEWKKVEFCLLNHSHEFIFVCHAMNLRTMHSKGEWVIKRL